MNTCDVQKVFQKIFAFDDITHAGSDFEQFFTDGEDFTLGKLKVEVMHTPGHTLADLLYGIGDAAFGGDARQFYRCIPSLLSLADDLRSLP